MAGATVNIGTASTVGGSGYTAEVTNISWSGISRGAVDTTHMGTVEAGNFGGRTFMPTDLVDAGEITVECHFDPDTDLAIDAAAAAVTITFPLVTGDGSSATWAASGFCTSFEWNDPLEDKMVATMTIKMTGGVTLVAAAA